MNTLHYGRRVRTTCGSGWFNEITRYFKERGQPPLTFSKKERRHSREVVDSTFGESETHRSSSGKAAKPCI